MVFISWKEVFFVKIKFYLLICSLFIMLWMSLTHMNRTKSKWLPKLVNRFSMKTPATLPRCVQFLQISFTVQPKGKSVIDIDVVTSCSFLKLRFIPFSWPPCTMFVSFLLPSQRLLELTKSLTRILEIHTRTLSDQGLETAFAFRFLLS